MSGAPAPAPSGNALEALRNREYRLLLTGFVIGQSMMPLQFVTAIFWIQNFAGDALVVVLVAAISTVRGAGMVGFGLIGGALADRFDRRRLLMIAQAGGAVASLLIGGIMLLGWDGPLGLFLFFALTLLSSAAHAVDAPTRGAMVPEILGPRLTAPGLALNQAAMQLALPVSIFASGFLNEALGQGPVYSLTAIGHVGEVAILALMSYRTVFAHGGGAVKSVRGEALRAARDIRAGIVFARTKPTLLWIILLVVLMMALVMPPTGSLGPTWITRVVGMSEAQFSMIAVFWGLGAMLASLLMVGFSSVEHKGALVVFGVLLMSAGFIVFTDQPTPLNAVLGNIMLGSGMSVAMISSAALIAWETTNEVRGRVMSLMFLGVGMAQLASLPFGAAAQALGMEALWPPLAWGVFAFLALLAIARPSALRAIVPRDGRPRPPSAGARPPVPGVLPYIAQHAPQRVAAGRR